MTRTTETSTTRETGAIAHPAPEDVHQVPIAIDPAAELVGCLLQCDQPRAAELLDLVTNDDPADPRARQALELIRALVTRGLTPNVAAVAAHARTTGAATSEHQQQRLNHYLIDCWRASAGYANGRHIAAAIIEDAYRRAGIEYAQAVTQAAEERGLAEFEQVLGDRDRLRDLWRRHRLANGDSTVQEVGAA